MRFWRFAPYIQNGRLMLPLAFHDLHYRVQIELNPHCQCHVLWNSLLVLLLASLPPCRQTLAHLADLPSQ
uniref:Uncharacterized protein n=1 Tax=Arundo donax TaxID=35708 RepID=A0A0A9F9X8_ARUDO